MVYKHNFIESKSLFAIIVQLFILLIIRGFNTFNSDRLIAISIFSLFNTIAVIVLLVIISKKIFTISNLFMIFLAVFHFGQAWLFGFGGIVDKSISYDIFSLYSEQDLYNSLLFCLIAFNLISLFLLCFLAKKDFNAIHPNENSSAEIKYDRQNVLKFGLIFFIILLIPVVVYDYLIVSITSQYGHVGLYDYSSELSVWAAANSYFPLAIIMVLLGSDPKKNGWKWIYYYAVARCLLLMVLTGKRGSFVIPLLLYFFCKHNFIQKYKKKHIIWIILGIILLLSGISFVSYGRGDYSNLNFWDFLGEKNIVSQTLSEFGSTFITMILSYSYTLAEGLLNGKSYLGALTVLLPFSDYIAPGIKEYYSVSAILNPYSPSGGALGGSLFGEMYINFGYYSLFLSPLFAWAVAKVDKIINNRSKYKLFTICCSVYIAYSFWISIRGNLVDIVFISKRILYVLIIYYIYKFIFGRKQRDERKHIGSL